MIIELRGVEFVNKGAELMLYAIQKVILNKFPNAILCMEPKERSPMSKLKENGIFIKADVKKMGFNIGVLLPKFILRKKSWVLPSEVNIIIDASGFAFGDQWGAEYAERRLGHYIYRWRKENKKIILLPQALGPFNNKDLQVVMKKIFDNANLIFAREKLSYNYASELSNTQKLKLAPDFTNLISGKVPANFDSSSCQVAIVPNYKMIEKSLSEEEYFKFLKRTIQIVKSNSLNPYFLIHEGRRDRSIAEKINAVLQEKIPIIHFTNALEIKGVISTAHFIICSRFHGVVSALSQGVPCLATSWSHKYEMLMEEYGVKDYVVSDLNDFENLTLKINSLSGESNKKISDLLKRNSLLQKRRTKEMWDMVYNIIE